MVAAWLVLAAGLGVYCNSGSVPFLFDDVLWIAENPHIRQLWPLWPVLMSSPQSQVALRPVVNLTLALNYAAGGLHVFGYHLVNLAIHLLAALTLYGLVRRTLALPSAARGGSGRRAEGVALAVALLWVVHPLTTESVTYLIQRAESLMGLCYLVTLYSVIRGWPKRAILACALGMATKPVMVTAPLLVVLYDRCFLAGSVRAAWRQRRSLYLGLAATWGLLGVLLTLTVTHHDPTVGLALRHITPVQYLLTQPGVILHYLRLACWPHPLILDYHWPVATDPAAMLLPLLVTGALVIATLWALRRHPPLGFLGAWVFGILAPSSSIIPIADIAVEHRMYLPLAGLLVLAVLALERLLYRAVAAPALRARLAIGLLAAAAVALGATTLRRNAVYRDPVALWQATTAARPDNPRAHNNLGLALAQRGQLAEATARFAHAASLDPDYAQAHNNLGIALAKQGRLEEAVAHYRRALALEPGYAKAHNNLAVSLARQGKLDEAIAHYAEALRLRPGFVEAEANLARAQAALDGRISAR